MQGGARASRGSTSPDVGVFQRTIPHRFVSIASSCSSVNNRGGGGGGSFASFRYTSCRSTLYDHLPQRSHGLFCHGPQQVLPGGEIDLADRGMKTIDLLSAGPLSPESTRSDLAIENRLPQQGVIGRTHGRVTDSNLRNGRSPTPAPQGTKDSPALGGPNSRALGVSNSSSSSCAGMEGEESRAEGAATTERVLQPLRRGGGGGSATNATLAFEHRQGAVSDSEGGVRAARYGGSGEDWVVEDGIVEDFKVHEDADRDGLEDRFVMDVPTLLPSASGPAVQPYLAKVNTPEPRAKIAEDDSDENNDDEATFRYLERGDSRSFSQHSLGRRASINIKHGVGAVM